MSTSCDKAYRTTFPLRTTPVFLFIWPFLSCAFQKSIVLFTCLCFTKSFNCMNYYANITGLVLWTEVNSLNGIQSLLNLYPTGNQIPMEVLKVAIFSSGLKVTALTLPWWNRMNRTWGLKYPFPGIVLDGIHFEFKNVWKDVPLTTDIHSRFRRGLALLTGSRYCVFYDLPCWIDIVCPN